MNRSRPGAPREPVNLEEFQTLARGKLAREVYDYCAGGAGDELTLRANRAAWDRLALRYRVLAGAGARDLSTTVLGHELRLPALVAPMALQSLVHPDGEVATARAAHAAGAVMVLSMLSSAGVEDVVKAAPGRVWYQGYVLRSRRVTARAIARGEAAGCTALVLTVDAPLPGRRERDLRNAFQPPAELAARHLLPGDLAAAAGELSAAGGLEAALDPSLSWADLAWLRSLTRLPLVLKGVVRGDDAARAVDHGAAAIVVSNHGGRQLDTAPATADVLAEVVDAVGGRAEVLVDGGIRRGTDVVKALCLGAKAVLVGRPVLWGLAADGERGVTRVLAMLREELDTALALCGAKSLSELARDLLTQSRP